MQVLLFHSELFVQWTCSYTSNKCCRRLDFKGRYRRHRLPDGYFTSHKSLGTELKRDNPEQFCLWYPSKREGNMGGHAPCANLQWPAGRLWGLVHFNIPWLLMNKSLWMSGCSPVHMHLSCLVFTFIDMYWPTPVTDHLTIMYLCLFFWLHGLRGFLCTEQCWQGHEQVVAMWLTYGLSRTTWAITTDLRIKNEESKPFGHRVCMGVHTRNNPNKHKERMPMQQSHWWFLRRTIYGQAHIDIIAKGLSMS